MGKHSKTQRLEAQRENLTALGDLQGLCPILREECLLHDDSSGAVHFSVEQSTHAQAVVFRDKIFRNVQQVRSNFTSAEARIMDTLIDLVVKCKQGHHVGPDDVPKGPVVSELLRPGQATLVKDLHLYLAKRAKAQLVPSQKTAAVVTLAPVGAIDAGGEAPESAATCARPQAAVASPQSPVTPEERTHTDDSAAALKLATAAQQRAVLTQWGLPKGLCPFPPTDCRVHGSRDPSHVPVVQWSVAQATAYRDVVWPKILRPATPLNDAEGRAFGALLDALVSVKEAPGRADGRRPPPRLQLRRGIASPGFEGIVDQIHRCVQARDPEVGGAATEAVASDSTGAPPPPPPAAGADVPRGDNLPLSTASSDERPRDEFDVLAAAMANARGRHEATAAENGELTAQVAALTRDAHDAGNEIAALKAQISDVERQLRDDNATSQSAMVRLEARAQQAEDRADRLRIDLATSQKAAAADKKRVADANEEQSARHQRELCEARTELLRHKHHPSPAGSVTDVAAGTAAIALLIRATRSALQLRPGGRAHYQTPCNYYDAPAIPNPCALLAGDDNDGPPTPCLALARFRNGLATALGLGCVSELAHGADNDRVIIAFHGTQSAENILCQGFDTSKRSGQNYGPGEYFARDWDTAEEYATRHTVGTGAGGTRGVIVALLVAAKARAVYSGNWFVVDNPAADTSVSYCLPLLFVPVRQGTTLQQCTRCHPKGASTTPIPAAVPSANVNLTAVEFNDDSDTWTPMAPAASATVLAAKASGTTHNVLRANGFTYDFDWQRMVQINTHTGRERSIRFV